MVSISYYKIIAHLIAKPGKMDVVRAPYKRTRVIASQGEEMEQHIVTPGEW